jgi:hypothetical protein
MRCIKCGRLDPSLVLGECLSCICAEQAEELRTLRQQNERLLDQVRDLERDNFRLRNKE